MKKKVILRTAVGSLPSVSIIKHLKNLGFCVIGVDTQEYSCGRFFCDKFYKIKGVKEEGFLEEILEICEKEKVNYLHPALDEEMILFAENIEKFKKTKVILPDKDAVYLACDKYKTYLFLKGINIKTPETFLPNQKINKNFPKLIKPRWGRGSKKVFIVENKRQIDFFISYLKQDLIIQDFIEGKEYTIDVLADENGNLLFYSTRERIRVESGISVITRITSKPQLKPHIEKITKQGRFKYLFNIQGIESLYGEFYFIEINLRAAGSCVASISANYPLLESLYLMLEGKEIKMPQLTKNILMTRYYDEFFTEDILSQGL